MRSVVDIVRSHVHLPVNRDLAALKQVLREWVKYSEEVPLVEKPSFMAMLEVRVLRPRPTAHGSSSPRGSWSMWKRGGTSSSSSDLHVFDHRVPLQLWTALLPWEVQRGLSGTSLRGRREGPSQPPQPQQPTHTDASAEEDPLGVVTTTPPTHIGASSSSPLVVADASSGMLFILDAKSVQQHGIHFWSGAIIHPLDVLFIAPTLATSVADSHSFQKLRQREVAKLSTDLRTSSAVLSRFFPDGELQQSSFRFFVQSHARLDPFDVCADAQSMKEQRGGAPQHFVEPNHSSPSPSLTREADSLVNPRQRALQPRFVVELMHGVVRSAVEDATRLSAAAYADDFDGACANMDEAEVEVELQLSQPLRDDLLAKAQLYAHYVESLEANVAHHLKLLNTSLEDGGAEEPLSASSSSSSSADGSSRVQVWMSETESRWMSRQELAEMQAKNDASAATTISDMREDDEHYEEEEEHIASCHEYGSSSAVATHMPSSSSPMAPSSSMDAHDATPLTNSAPPPRLMATRSPMLAEEDEGRPSQLVPSFSGKLTSPTNTYDSNVLCTRASILAKYPLTHAHMPRLPPVDYELMELILHCGVGSEAAIFFYHERILRAWRSELKRLRSVKRLSGASSSSSSSSALAVDDRRRMLALVREPSLQVSEELRSVVEAVCHLSTDM